jgi:hypothetical protein
MVPPDIQVAESITMAAAGALNITKRLNHFSTRDVSQSWLKK